MALLAVGRPGARRTAIARVLALVLLLGADTASAMTQGRIVRATIDVTLTGPGQPARVQIVYAVRSDGDARALPLALMPFGATVRDVQASVDATPVGVARDTSRTRHEFEVPLPAGAARRELSIEVEYTIEGAWAADERAARIPILAALWAPASALPGTVRGTIRMPSAATPYDAFPSVLRSLGDDRWGFQLQVMPSLVTFRVAEGRKPLVTRATTVEVSALALLLVFAWFGWRRFRVEA